MDIGDGWMVDEADPTVGQFTDVIFHNDCEKWDGDTPPHAEQTTSMFGHESIPGLVNVVDTFTCECGATKILTSQEPDSWFEEPRRDQDD